MNDSFINVDTAKTIFCVKLTKSVTECWKDLNQFVGLHPDPKIAKQTIKDEINQYAYCF